MTTRLVEEVREWNTPIVGAYLLWRFTKSYCRNHPEGQAPVMILHFIAEAILSSDELLKLMKSRRGLASYIRHFNTAQKTDLLANLSHRIYERRERVLAVIDIALATGLLALDSGTATLYPVSIRSPKGGRRVSKTMNDLGKKAEMLGTWFAKENFTNIVHNLGVQL